MRDINTEQLSLTSVLASSCGFSPRTFLLRQDKGKPHHYYLFKFIDMLLYCTKNLHYCKFSNTFTYFVCVISRESENFTAICHVLISINCFNNKIMVSLVVFSGGLINFMRSYHLELRAFHKYKFKVFFFF